MDSQTPSGGRIDIEHGLIIEVGIDTSNNGVLIWFLSGSGEVIDDDGDEGDPSLFSITLYPKDGNLLVSLVDALTMWMDREDPIDVEVEDGITVLRNTTLNATYQVSP